MFTLFGFGEEDFLDFFHMEVNVFCQLFYIYFNQNKHPFTSFDEQFKKMLKVKKSYESV